MDDLSYPYCRKPPRTQPGVVSFHPIFGSIWDGQSQLDEPPSVDTLLWVTTDETSMAVGLENSNEGVPETSFELPNGHDEMFCLLKTKPVINHEYIGMIQDLQHATGDHVLSMPFPSESGCSFPSNQPEWPGGSMGKSYCHGCGPGESVPASGKPHKKTVVAMPM